MAAWLDQLFTALTPLWEMSLTGAYVAGIVFFLRLLLKGRAPRQAVCLLWLLVFARLLFPFSLESPFSAVPQALAEGQAVLLEQAPAPESPDTPASLSPGLMEDTQSNPQTEPQTGPQPGGQDEPAAVAPLPGQAQDTAPDPATPAQPQSPAPLSWRALAAGVWLAGTLAMLGYALISWLLLRRRLFDAVRAKAGVWEHPAVTSPFLLGIFRPRIYLPAHLPAKNRFFILCHEQTHLRRGDHMVKPVCWLALSLHWFNPMAWLAFLLLSRDLEAACDEAVLRRLGEQCKGDYSAALLSAAAPRRFPAPCPLAFGGNSAKDRIKAVLRYKVPALWVLAAAVVVVIVAAVVLLTDPMAEQADPDAEATGSVPATATPEPAVTLPDGAVLLCENPQDGLAVYRTDGASPIAYLVSGQQVLKLSDWYSDTVTDLRLTDLDGDGEEELAVTGAQYSGSGGFGILTVLEQKDGQWDTEAPARLAMDSELGGRLVDDVLANAALRYEQGDPCVTFSLGNQQFVTLTVGDELAQRRGTYRLEDGWQSATLFWWEDVPYVRLVLPLLFQPDPGEGEHIPAGVGVEAVLRLSCDSQGLFTVDPEALLPACGQLSTLPAALSGGENGVSLSGDTGLPVYHEDSLTLLSFRPNLGISLYALPDGALVLRSGPSMGPLPEDYVPSDTLYLEYADDRGLTFRRSGGDGTPQAVTRLERDPETAAWREVFAVRFPQGHGGNPFAFEDETFTFSTPQGEIPFQASGLFGDWYTRTYRADLDGDGAEEYLFLPLRLQGTGAFQHYLYVFRQGPGGWEALDASDLWPGFEAASLTADKDNFYITAPGGLSATVPKSELLGRFPDLELNDTLALGGSRYVQLYSGQVVLNQALLAGSSPQAPEVTPAILRAPLVLENSRPALGPLSLQYNYTYVPSYA